MHVLIPNDVVVIDIPFICRTYRRIKHYAIFLVEIGSDLYYQVHLDFGNRPCDTVFIADLFNVPHEMVAKIA